MNSILTSKPKIAILVAFFYTAVIGFGMMFYMKRIKRSLPSDSAPPLKGARLKL